MSKIITRILNDKNLSESERVRLTREWLKTEYRIKDVKDIAVLTQLSLVHNHDNLPLHFGEVEVGSSFNTGYVRIVEVNEGWHLAYSRTPGKNFIIIHPGYEKAGVIAENLKTLNLAKSLFKTGTLPKINLPGETQQITPTSGLSQMVVTGLDETPVTDESDLKSSYTTDDVTGNVSSINIDMSQYLK